jgi:hypothetical protein
VRVGVVHAVAVRLPIGGLRIRPEASKVELYGSMVPLAPHLPQSRLYPGLLMHCRSSAP